ncbi:hypothetical protein FOMPIDRAFT_1058408 [Fomitopsis schrenkii]|uniref:RING-type domain-containing protein n=1 Tax=Fomitopsis schrenkii TaxID=2126942 RepID=S8G1A2_FOMSC|nr:hypothetical protein FOMPIDRAFT_1058408 [Fomitopsis schrenkii]
MYTKCSICFDALGPASIPVATRCGHLYCLDCATFNFARPDARCAICRTPHTLKKLVKLYPDYEQASQTPGPSADPRRAATAGRRPANASAPAMQGKVGMDIWDESTLVDIALDRADAAICRSNFRSEARADLRISLKALRSMLQTMYAKMEDNDRAAAVKAEVQQLKRENARLKAQVDEQKQRRRQEVKRAAAQWEQERGAFLTMHSGLQDKLQKLRSEMRSLEGKLAKSEEARVASEQEMKLWRKSANRSKKKYYVLKAETRASRRNADSDNDSLEVV